MSTLELDGLSGLLEGLSLSEIPATGYNADVLSNPLEVYRSVLAALLVTLVDCEESDAYKSIQWPNSIFNGDISVTLPRLRPGCKPAELSSELVDKFPKDHPLFDLPLPEGVHLRVFLKLEVVPRLLLPYILDRKQAYGVSAATSKTEEGQKKIVIEFSSPNITSEFQGKHLRSTIIGAFLGRLHGTFGWDVTRINYLGDWGKPIALLFVGWKKFGSEEAYEADPVGHLLDVYHKIDQEFQPEQLASRHARDEAAKEGKDEGESQAEIESKGIFAERNEAFKKLEDGDEELVAFWNRIRAVIIKDYVSFYERIGIRFDEYSGESQVTPEVMTEVEQMLKEKSISEESSGSWMIDMKKVGARSGHAIVRDRSGSSTYLLRDLATVLERSRKYSFDKMVYVVAGDNSVHFNQLFKILEALDADLASKLRHVKFSEVSKMPATLGNGYKPQAILDICEEAVKTFPEGDTDKIALIGSSEQSMKALATSALLVQELSTRLTSAHAFDTAALHSFKRGSGPDLQYWYSKLRHLLADHEVTAALSDEELDTLADEDRANLLRTLAQYPEVVNTTYHLLEPSDIVTYLAGVIAQLSDCLNEQEGKVEVTPGIAALLEATRIVLENGMKLLGLVPIADIPQERADTPVAT